MKTKGSFILMLLLLFAVSSGHVFGQFQNTPATGGNFGRTNPNIDGIGIGTWPIATPTNARLHVSNFHCDNQLGVLNGFLFRTDGGLNVLNQWQMFTGNNTNNLTENGKVFVWGNNPVVADRTNFSIQTSIRDMTFFTSPIVNNTVGAERMRIVGVSRWMNWPIGATVRAGNIGIGTANPLTMLNIGGNSSYGAGARDWMDIGTLYSSRQGYDNMYVGLDSVGSDQYDAIINWGNNPANTPDGDRLRFVFTAATGIGTTASGQAGLEAARLVSDGNVSRFGVGDFLTLNDNPKRQLDVFDDGMTGTNPPAIGRPQFRITQTLSTNITQGVFTDFHCTGSNNTYNPNSSGTDGHLLINPRSKDTPRTVAINFEDGNTQIFGGLSLDVNGQQNIRTVNQDNSQTHVLVWDDSNEGRIMWRDVNSIGGAGNDADWFNQNNIGNVPLNITDPIYTFNNVAIGASNSITSRTYIYNNNEKISLYVNSDIVSANPTWINYGTYVWAHGVSGETYAIYGNASGGSLFNMGIRGEASGTGSSVNYGVYGAAIPNPNAPYINYAGYFSGNVAYTGLVNPSDIKIKENITDIENPLQIIEQLLPRKYNYKYNDYPSMNLPTGIQYGLIAQEIENVLPEIVSMNIHPALYDSTGNILQDSIHYKGLNYEAIIPILIGAIQDQQDSIENLQNLISSYETRFQLIENMIATCCSQNKSASVDVVIQTKPAVVPLNNNQLGQNYPNPFKTVTTFTYTISADGYVEFVIEDSFGKKIETKVSQNQTKGSYSFDWEPTNVIPGIYFYSLRVNGEILVKKAIKIE